jgi:hypothetical protein
MSQHKQPAGVWPPKGTAITDWVAVMGGATTYTEEQIQAAYRVGLTIAQNGKNVITGATTGIPYAAALGAKDGGALVIGVSPADDPVEHVRKFGKPLDALDLIIYSGLSFAGRGPLIIRSAAACIFIGGEFGTLNEFSSAWLIGNRLLGVLPGYGGMTKEFAKLAHKTKMNWGCQLVIGKQPEELVRRLVRAMNQVTPKVRFREHPGRDVRQIVSRYRAMKRHRL